MKSAKIPEDFNVRKLPPMYCRNGDIRKAAERLGLSKTAIENYQRGKRAPNAMVIRKVCAMNHVKADDLLQIPPICRLVPKAISGTMGRRIRYARTLNTASLEDAAALAGVNYQTIKSWESGKTAPAFWKLRQFCIAMTVSADWIIGKEGGT